MEMMKRIKKYYDIGVYSNGPWYGDFVEVFEEGSREESLFLPARNAFLAVLCSAMDLHYSGSIFIDFHKVREDLGGEPAYEFKFENGKPTPDWGCHYHIYGMELLP